MTVYKLRNGLSIDLTFNTPTVFDPRPAILEFDPSTLTRGALNAYPLPLDGAGNPVPATQLISMTANGLLSGASADLFGKCSLRFIQVIKVRTFDLLYYGKRQDEGAVTWSWKGQLLQRNIDCVVRKGVPDPAPYQVPYPEKSDHFPPNTLTARLGDTPGASIPLAEFNGETNRDNYLRLFNDQRTFESIVTFVHDDGSREMLESWKWRFVRSVALKWVKLKPDFDGPNHIQFLTDPSATSVFGKDADYAATLSSGRIANRITTAAMANIKTSPDIDYVAIEKPGVLPPPQFWSP